MALCAASVAGICMAESSVESANIVGYQNNTSVAGFNWYAPNFLSVGTTSINIQDIKLSGDNVTSYGDNIQILDEGGATLASYTWATSVDSGLDSDGWVDDQAEDTMLATITLTKGQGILLDTGNEGVVVTFAGEVVLGETKITSISGFNFIGNASVLDLNIQDIKLSGDNVTSYGDNIQILDEGGATLASYTWATSVDSGLDSDGWVDDQAEDTMLATITLTEGQGFLIDTGNEGVVITYP